MKQTLQGWITQHANKRSHSEWLEFPYLRIFVRRTQRYRYREILPTLELASMEVHELYRSTGVVTRFVAEAERIADKEGLTLYVESILEPRFASWWKRRGYMLEYPGWPGIGDPTEYSANAWREVGFDWTI